MRIYQVVDGAGQTVAVYSNREAAELHAMAEEGGTLEFMPVSEMPLWDDYVPGRNPWAPTVDANH